MTDDLTTRIEARLELGLRESASYTPHEVLLRQARALILARDAVIAEALARSKRTAGFATSNVLAEVRSILEQGGCPTCGSPDPALHPHEVNTCKDPFHSRVPQGAAKPERKFNMLDSRRPWGEGAAEPWTDPKPWVGHSSGERYSDAEVKVSPNSVVWMPRTRAQYDAEEARK